ncbi:MAG TPA: hypothetical protein VK712_03055 [Verrucomicrobiae bacterium]|jgi:hypothetical protein|nr:hypothetical protein [Verrucomicrobiae bacterium]
MSNSAYYVKARDILLRHNDRPGRISLFNDWSNGDSPSDINALVASGDCFITLATTIEAVNNTLTVDRPIASPQLERLTAVLLYLQRHYQIRRKPANYRQ